MSTRKNNEDLKSRLCLSIAEPNYQACSKRLKGVAFGEVRLDLCHLELPEIDRLFSSKRKLIATCRPGKFPEKQRLHILVRALQAGASYVDIEVESPTPFIQEIKKAVKRHKAQLIISYHNERGRLKASQLRRIKEKCFALGATLTKISCAVQSKSDSMVLLDLLNDPRPMIVTGMGVKGVPLRIVAPLFGSHVAYITSEGSKATAEGQLTRAQMLQAWKVLGVL